MVSALAKRLPNGAQRGTVPEEMYRGQSAASRGRCDIVGVFRYANTSQYIVFPVGSKALVLVEKLPVTSKKCHTGRDTDRFKKKVAALFFVFCVTNHS